MMQKFNYQRMVSRWDKFDRHGRRISSGSPTDKLVQRAQEMASVILWKTDFGISMEELSDIYWPDHLWNIHDDEELFSRVSEKIVDLIDEAPWPAKDRKEMIRAVENLRFDNGIVRLPTEEES
jgi:hypothetical protein